MGTFLSPSSILCSDGLLFVFPYSLMESSIPIWLSYSFDGAVGSVLLLRGHGLL